MKKIVISAISFGLIGMLLTGCGVSNTKSFNSSATSPSPTANNKSNSAVKSPSKIVKTTQSKRTNNKNIPKWFKNDYKIASSAKFPIQANTYELSLDEVTHKINSGSLRSSFQKQTKNLWLGQLTTSQNRTNFNYGFQKLDGNISSINNQTKTIFVQEQNNGNSGWGNKMGYFVPAKYVNWGNGEFLAFASNQVITMYEHDAVISYTVYPIKGIKVPF